MKTFKTVVCAFAGVMLFSASVPAAVVSLWDFSSGGMPNSTSTRSSYLSANPTVSESGGSATLSVTGGALQLAYNGSHPEYLNGSTLLLSLSSGSGTFTGLSVKFTDSFTALTALNGQWSYRVGTSGTFTSFGSSVNLVANSAPNTALPTSLSFLPGQTLQLQFVLSGAAGNNNGSFRFDNLEVDSLTAVPEPVHYALGVFGCLVVGVGIRRRFLSRAEQA
jgi:hypothetical protein